MTSLCFSDQQQKQKAYDRYYNAVARQDFVQGQKLQSLIQKQALDDATASQLADVYQRTRTKTREFDYKKLYTSPSQPGYKPVDKPTDKSTAKPTKKKKFVHVVSDTDAEEKAPIPDANMKEPTNDADYFADNIINDKNAMNSFRDYYNKIHNKFTPEEVKEKLSEKVAAYMAKNKDIRTAIFNKKENRDLSIMSLIMLLKLSSVKGSDLIVLTNNHPIFVQTKPQKSQKFHFSQ